MALISLDFVNQLAKQIEKIENITVDFPPPGKWYHSGNFALNKIISGVYSKGIPEKRLTVLAGASGCLPADEKIEIYIMKSQKQITPIHNE